MLDFVYKSVDKTKSSENTVRVSKNAEFYVDSLTFGKVVKSCLKNLLTKTYGNMEFS
jgi:hypothetical protein